MFPLLEVAGAVFPTYNILLAFGILAGLITLFFAARRKRLALSFLADHFFALFFPTMLTARLTELISREYSLSDFPFFWTDTGFDFYGGAIGFLVALIVICKKNNESFFTWLDPVSLSAATILFFHHIGTFLEGSAYGIATSLPFGVTFTDTDSAVFSDLPLHPVQIYYAFFVLVFFIISGIIFRRTRKIGKTGAFLILTISTSYFFLDFLRDDSAPTFGFLRISQYSAILLAGLATIFIVKLKYHYNAVKINELSINKNH